MDDNEPLVRRCANCRAQPGEECVWSGHQNQRFHKCRIRLAPLGNSAPEPPDSEEWRWKQHVAYHKLHWEHSCADYPAIIRRLPLIYERQLVAG